MMRRTFFFVMLMGLLSGSMGADVPGSPATILVISWFPWETMAAHVDGVKKNLSREGLFEGREYRIEFRQARTQESVDQAIARFQQDRLIVYTANTTPGRLVRRNGTTAAHVFLTYSDPLVDGWIASYVRPGGSATGVVEYAPVHRKRLELLSRLLPATARIAILLEATSDAAELRKEASRFGVENTGIQVEIFPVAQNETAAGIAARLRAAAIQGVYVPLQGNVDAVTELIYSAVAIAALPAISERRADLSRGAVLAYEVDRNALRERIANQLALILHGTPPAEIPVHSPRKFLLGVNLVAAAKLGVRIPRALLVQADQVISHAD